MWQIMIDSSAKYINTKYINTKIMRISRFKRIIKVLGDCVIIVDMENAISKSINV